MQIHIDRDGQQMGPYKWEEVQSYLAQGSLLPTDNAWYEGLESWVPLSQLVPQQAAPVPVAPAPIQAAAVPEQVAAAATVPAQGGGKKKLLIGIGAGVGVLAILTAVWFFLIRDDGSKSGSADANVPAPWVPPGEPGKLIWEFKTGGSLQSSPAIGSDGTVYIGSVDNKVYALNGKSGAKKWEFETGESEYGVRSSPAIGSDGTVYVGSDDKKLYALDGENLKQIFVNGKELFEIKKLWEFETADPVPSSPVIGANGIVYIGSGDGKVYAIASSSQGLAKSPWPMRGQNARHTGRVMKK